MISKKAILICVLLFSFSYSFCQGRDQWSINDNWKYFPGGLAYAEFEKFDDSKWQMVSVPHTWNAFDPFDDDKTYRRTIGWYRKNINIDIKFRNKSLFVCFEGAAQVADVYVNGSFVGRHKGSYTAFSFNITPYVKWNNETGTAIVAVQVNNAHDPYISPLSIGYASYGGINRDVWLIATDGVHFNDVNTHSSGVYISTPTVNNSEASVAIKTTIRNDGKAQKNVRWINKIVDAAGRELTTLSSDHIVNAGDAATVHLRSEAIQNIRLWTPDAPYLYTVKSQLMVDGSVADEVVNEIGFRWFSFNADSGFSLNGNKLVLRGTNRHQDMQDKGDALCAADHEKDIRLIKDMGANFLRLAHYPQVPQVLKLADRLGLLVWEEVPVLNFITESEEFVQNAEQSIHEMITQGYNHPSIIIWGFANEILLYGKNGVRIASHADTSYLNTVRKFMTRLHRKVNAEDSTRPSTMAMHGSEDYYKYKLDVIPDVAAFNIYNGWYSGKLEHFGADMDRYHKRQPKQVLFVSEYGAEGEIRLASEHTTRMDYTAQYQRIFHESYLRQIKQRQYLAGTAIWNQFDFSQPNIGGPAPHMNQKGMVTWSRKPKDAYYLYKANWNPEPMVYIATRDWLTRAGDVDSSSAIDVYSNLGNVVLTVNGVAQPKQQPNDVSKCSWRVKLREGANVINASATSNGKTYSDFVTINYKVYQAKFSPAFKSLSVNAGSNAQYIDPSGNIWIEDRIYKNGSFGYTTGVPQMFSRNEVIRNTDDEPMYYSYVDSITAYRFDVPDGDYRLSLCFAEPKYQQPGQRVFNVAVNSNTILKELDLAAEAGFATAIKKTFVVRITNGKGLLIGFDAIEGSAIINGIQLERI